MSIEYNLTVEDIQEQAEKLLEFHGRYSKHFRSKTRNVSNQALEYLKGQLLCEARRNMSKMSLQVTEIDKQALSHFISTSPWNEEPIMEDLCKEVINLMCPQGQEGALIIDESGFPKQGKKSVGVARQYCGNLGKVDNCQVGVFIAFANERQATIIDKRIYLPAEWTNDPERCKKAGVPESIEFKTKAELGLEMIKIAKERQVPFGFVAMDCHYGQQPKLLSELGYERIKYIADVPCDTRVYLENPTLGIPQRNGTRGPNPTKLRVLGGEAVEVRNLLNTDFLQWHTLKIRDVQRGELWIKFAALRVYRIEDQLPEYPQVWLLIRKDLDSEDIRFSFSNLSPQMPIELLAQKQSVRYWVERTIQDAKGLAGMDEYQVLSWRAWHHHITMVLLAMLFLLFLQQNLIRKAPMLTLSDARDILAVVLPRKVLSHQDAVDLIYSKHLNRFCSRQSRLKTQKDWLWEHHNVM